IAIVGFAVLASKSITLRDILKIAIGYLVYSFASYFILVSVNINNPDFEMTAWDDNVLWETNFIKPLLIILGLSFFLRYLLTELGIHKKSQRFLPEYGSNHFLLACLIGSFAVQDSKLFAHTVANLSAFANEKFLSSFLTLLALNTVITCLAFILLSHSMINGLRDLKNNQASFELVLSASTVFSLIFNYTIQIGVQSDQTILGYYLFPGAFIYQFTILFSIFLLIYFVTNRVFIGTLIIVSLGTIVSVVNSLKEGLRSEPLLVTDFVWIKEISLISSFVEHKILINIFLTLTAAVLLFLLGYRRWLPGKIYDKKRIRTFGIIAILSLWIGIFAVFRTEKDSKIMANLPIISKLNNFVDITWLGFTKNASYKSLMYVWTKQITKEIMPIPEGYSKASIKAIVDKYSLLADQINQERHSQIEDHTVIYILSESFADPLRLPGVIISEEILPNIKSYMSEYTSGTMRSDFYGGGTANMEIQTLIGLPYYNLSPSVSVMNTEVIPKMSYVPTISNFYENKDKVAVHFHNGANYSRNIIYKDFGFDTFIALGGTDDEPTMLEFNGANASDKTTYYAIESQLTEDSSQFFSAITMQNHIPWEKDEPAEIVASGEGFSDEENKNLSNYARLLKDTDTMTKDFLDVLSHKDKNITVVFYGDHLPGLYPSSVFNGNPNNQYQTDYFVWSNFTALVFKQTNSKVSPYYALLTQILETEDRQNPKESESLTAEELKQVEYDLMLGKGYLLEYPDFFNVKE
ncbi:LTA synthase family protein, partial [Streptococcus merionis]|uniref:LTA synthase family protein n=1 Tax=Streptococcus merionis TaxID=400065 RepID=UPI0026F07218